MSDQFIGEIRLFPYPRGAPSGWLACDGGVQQIADYPTLYQLLGTTYGGDGSSSFGLPDLRGRVPVHQGTGTGLSPRMPGQLGGSETATLFTAQIPPHAHSLLATGDAASTPKPAQAVLATLADSTMYLPDPSGATALDPMPQAFGSTGQGVAHDNCAPSLPLLACIAAEGMWPAKP